MITAVMLDTIVEVQISGTIPEFARDLETLKKDIPAGDREFLDHRKAWVVRHPEQYRHVPYIANAMKSRESQLSLF